MRTIFCNVDTAYDFMRKDGKLYVPGAEVIEANLEALTRTAEENGITVLNTADWHTRDSVEISDKPDYIMTFPMHCEKGTQGAEFVPATKPRSSYVISWEQPTIDEKMVISSRNITLLKDRFDVFDPEGNRHSGRVIELLRPELAVVYGVATNVCVDYHVEGLRMRGIEVEVPLDAIKELPGLPLDKVLRKWERLGVRLTTTEEVLRRYK